MLEQGHDVGEALVKGQHIDVGGLGEALMQPVEEGMRHFMGNHIMRQASEDCGARGDLHRALGCRKIAEKNADLGGVIVGVGFTKCMGVDPEPVDKDLLAPLPA